MQDATLFAVGFDVDRLEPIGHSVPVIEGRDDRSSVAAAQFAVSDTGTLVYLPGRSPTGDPPISWLDRTGMTTPLTTNPRNWSYPRFSPTGSGWRSTSSDGTTRTSGRTTWAVPRWIVLTFGTEQRGRRARVDARRSACDLPANANSRRRQQPLLAAGGCQGRCAAVDRDDANQFPGSWHPSGKYFAFVQQSQQTNPDIWVLPMEGDEASGWKPGKPTVLVNTPAIEQDPGFSPDGRWLAFVSDQSGSAEVYVRPFPGSGGPWQISSGGGYSPVWSRTNRNCFSPRPLNTSWSRRTAIRWYPFRRNNRVCGRTAFSPASPAWIH